MFTCTKEYSDIPFAHRQHNHKGHCSLIHGHNWAFRFTFSARELDENGFVFDFGNLKQLKHYIDEYDHALLLNSDDPEIDFLTQTLNGKFAKVICVQSASSEGLAQRFCLAADRIVANLSNGRVRCISCVCIEDSRNSAQWSQVVSHD